MSCPSEQTWSIHADGELPAPQSAALEAHLEGCPACSQLLRALRQENELLGRALADAPAATVEKPLGVPAVLLALVAAAAAVRAVVGWLGELRAIDPIGLVDPPGIATRMAIDSLFYLLREGASMLQSAVSTLAVMAVLAVVAVLLVVSLRKQLASALALILLLAWTQPALALERRVSKDGRVLVPAGETIDDSLFAAGDVVTIEGTVNGNLIAAGRRIVVRGTVKGDLLTASQRLDVEGQVEGNALSVAETIVFRGPLARSAYCFAEDVQLDARAAVEGDLVGFGREVQVDGRVGRDLLAFAAVTGLAGEVQRHASAWTGRLDVGRSARVGGDLHARVGKASDVRVDPQARIGGATRTQLHPARTSRYRRPSFYAWKAVWLAAAFVTGLLLQRLLPGLFPRRLPQGSGLGRAVLIGFACLVAVPVAAVAAALTLVGLPLGLFALGVWLAGLYVSHLVVASLVGHGLLRRGGPPPSFAPALLVGLLVVWLLVSLPYLGGLVRLGVIVLGLGLALARLRAAGVPEPA